MIQLTKDTTNQIAVTLTELSDPNLPDNWLFIFTLEQEDSYSYPIFLTDTSTNTERYNLFELVLPTDIDFKFLGDYQYNCYQMPDTNDFDYTRGIQVEIGKMRLFDAIEIIPTFTPNTNTTIYDASNI